jgi:anti-sigma factor RsiW
MNCPDIYTEYMHDYLDEEITPENEIKLREHLLRCADCQNHFQELKKTIALVQSTSHIQAPVNFTAAVMARLPNEKKQVGFKRWFRKHPMVAAASLFLTLMVGSLITGWNEEQEFSVSKNPDLVIQNHTVIVPKGKTVNGDIVVKNGDLKIEGQVDGNVTVINGEINGEKYLASAGHVTGEIEEINQLFDWVWYHMKKITKDTVSILQ